MFGYKARGKCMFPNMSVKHDVLTTHLMRSLMFHPYIYGVRLRVLPLLLFHKAFCLFQFRFSYAFANFSFKEIIGGPSITFNFPVSFLKLSLQCPCYVFCVSVCRVLLGQEVLVSS